MSADLRGALEPVIARAVGFDIDCGSTAERKEAVSDGLAQALALVADWLRREETGDLVAEATEKHHLADTTDAMGNNACACGPWWDTAEIEGWDQHMAYVGLAALATALTAIEGN